jgi:hypothetical protein
MHTARVATALPPRPSLLVLDEPANGLNSTMAPRTTIAAFTARGGRRVLHVRPANPRARSLNLLERQGTVRAVIGIMQVIFDHLRPGGPHNA